MVRKLGMPWSGALSIINTVKSFRCTAVLKKIVELTLIVVSTSDHTGTGSVGAESSIADGTSI